MIYKKKRVESKEEVPECAESDGKPKKQPSVVDGLLGHRSAVASPVSAGRSRLLLAGVPDIPGGEGDASMYVAT